MYLDKKNRELLSLEDEIQVGFSILNYNQGLIQFADSKANALLLINSIFIASIGPFLGELKRGGMNFGSLLVMIFFASSICSILLALGVITTRKVSALESNSRSPIFYGSIVDSRTPEGYIQEMQHIDAAAFHESLLQNIFVVAKIAAKKYGMYNYAQSLTIVSCIFWILSIIYLLQA
jgi:hypothetical protein